MKVLFEVKDKEISSAIIKKYREQYKEIVSSKNVYYFNAILKELQKDKSYDVIVISEELEKFTNTNYEQMDRFIFDRLDSISDEASNSRGADIPIILICTERRTKGEALLVKLFGIGIYNAIIGNDRSINEVCRLINKPRSKKEAKEYYKIDSDDVNYEPISENEVSEEEIQNILSHYKRIGKNEEKYVESFENIATQYNDIQLKIIAKFLPLNVRAVLEEKCSSYQKLMSINPESNPRKIKKQEVSGTSEKLLKSDNTNKKLSDSIVIPSAINTQKVKKLLKEEPKKVIEPEIEIEENYLTDDLEEIENAEEPIVKEVKRGRGRPRKVVTEEEKKEQGVKRGRGRPRKNIDINANLVEPAILPGFDEIEEEETTLPEFDEIEEEAILPGFDEIEEETILPGFDEIEEEEATLPGFDEIEEEEATLPGFDEIEEEEAILPEFDEIEETPTLPKFKEVDNDNIYYENTESFSKKLTSSSEYNSSYDADTNILISGDKKIVSFVGTSKNGTSFIVNNVAELLSSTGVNVAILDTTKNKNSYYIYTNNDEELRKIAFATNKNLQSGNAHGIKVNKNLTVYTCLPNEEGFTSNINFILETLINNHSIVLIDCDFDTPFEYFKNSQEIYLIQTMDVLTIQPLTEFLRELKSRNILDESKLRIIINKYVKLRGISEKTIIGGIANFNDPAMTFMTELFDRNTIKYLLVPFEYENYVTYIESLINCDISLKGYTKSFIQNLKQIANTIYPLSAGNNRKYIPNQYQNNFSSNMNNTLNKMKKKF